jgi:hypothetical protein
MKTGARYKLEAMVAVEKSTKTIFNGEDIGGDVIAAGCKLSGELTVVEATPKGLAKELSFAFSSVECVEDGVKAKFFQKGDVVLLRHAEPYAAMWVNGAKTSPVQEEIIEGFLAVDGDDASTDDELSGTSKKVKAGESWEFNRAVFVADLVRDGLRGIKPEHLSGSMKLAKIEDFKNRPGMIVEGEFKVDATGTSWAELPDLRADTFKVRGKDQTVLPLDPEAGDLKYTMEMKIESDSSGTVEKDSNVANMRFQMKKREKSELLITPLK